MDIFDYSTRVSRALSQLRGDCCKIDGIYLKKETVEELGEASRKISYLDTSVKLDKPSPRPTTFFGEPIMEKEGGADYVQGILDGVMVRVLI